MADIKPGDDGSNPLDNRLLAMAGILREEGGEAVAEILLGRPDLGLHLRVVLLRHRPQARQIRAIFLRRG